MVNNVIRSLRYDEPPQQPSAQQLLSLARRRACSRLERGIDFPILIVGAPAGFGKTTVLREFLTATAQPYRRLNIGSKNGDVLGFMREFANCLGDLVPAFVTSFMGVYDRMYRLADAPRAIAAWAAGHLEPVALALMIDGIENVTDERLIALLIELVDQTAHMRMRWILVAQTPDRFPVARWLANDRMDLPFDDVDLTITYDDLHFAVSASGALLDERMLSDLCRSSANWPAAIALALTDIPALTSDAHSGSQRQAYEHFANGAFLARPAGERRFLLETCLYKHFDADLLSVAGWEGVGPVLDRLLEAGAFLFADTDGSFRYHELFRLFLETRLRSESGDHYRRVGARSAAVCDRVGRWSDALELYTDLQALEPLAHLLGNHGFELMDRGEADIVQRGLDALGDTQFADYPVALAVKASLESLNGSFDVAEAWFRHAIKNVGDSSQRGSVVFRFATDLVRQDRRDAIDLLQPIVAEGGHDLSLSASLAGLLATAYATHQQNEQSALTIERALDQLADVDDQAVQAKLYFQAGYVAFFAHDPVRAKDYAQRALLTALATHLYDIAARALSILYNVAMDHEDDVEAARRYLGELASCSIKAGSRHLQIYATLGLFEIEVVCGNLLESAHLDDALKSLDVDYSVFASETLLPAQALRATWSGDFHRAYRLIAPTADKQITPARQAQRYAEIGLYAAAAGLRVEAAAAVSRALATSPKGVPLEKSSAFTKVYVALALILLGRHGRVAQLLAELGDSTMLTPRLEHLIESVATINERWISGRYTAELRDVLERLDAGNFGGIGRLIEALPLPETFRGEVSQLTATEHEILVHMAAGMNSEEIASLCGYGSAAVDGVVLSICRKLGCTSERHAIALAISGDVLRTTSVNVS